jgi:hypothetical protein
MSLISSVRLFTPQIDLRRLGNLRDFLAFMMTMLLTKTTRNILNSVDSVTRKSPKKKYSVGDVHCDSEGFCVVVR